MAKPYIDICHLPFGAQVRLVLVPISLELDVAKRACHIKDRNALKLLLYIVPLKLKRRESKPKVESRSIFSMFPAIKKGDMVKSESSIVDVVAPVENFERNQKVSASCDIGICVKSVKNMKDKEIIDLVNNVWKPLTDYDFPKTTNNGITGS